MSTWLSEPTEEGHWWMWDGDVDVVEVAFMDGQWQYWHGYYDQFEPIQSSHRFLGPLTPPAPPEE